MVDLGDRDPCVGAMRATVGERIAYYRKRRGMTQEVLCGLADGRSTEWPQIENGERDKDKLSTIVAVANALKISPTVLLPGPFHSNPRQDDTLATAPDAVPDIESAMLRYDGMARFIGVPSRPSPALADLRRRMERAFVCSQTERWSEMAPIVPDIIGDACTWCRTRSPTRSAARHTSCKRSSIALRPACWSADRIHRRLGSRCRRATARTEQSASPLGVRLAHAQRRGRRGNSR